MTEVALILADTADTAENRSLLRWSAWVVDRGVDLVVVAWAPGGLLAGFAALAPTVDAAAVNGWAPARLCARLHLVPLARHLKNRRLRRMLEGVRTAPAVLVGGPRALAALPWLPPGERRVVARVSSSDLPLPAEALTALARCAAVTVPSVGVAAALGGVDPTRVHRSGVVVGPVPPVPDGPSRPGVAVVGIEEDHLDDLVEVARAIRRVRVDEQVHWVRRDPDDRWSWALFGDPQRADLAGRVHRLAPDEVVGAEVVLVAGPGDPTPAIQAARAGVPVIAVAGYDAPVGEEQPDLATAARRLGELTDAGERAATARRQTAAAEDHAVEAMGSALLDLVRGG